MCVCVSMEGHYADGDGAAQSPELDDATLALAMASTEAKSFTLASILDESDDDLSDIELDAVGPCVRVRVCACVRVWMCVCACVCM